MKRFPSTQISSMRSSPHSGGLPTSGVAVENRSAASRGDVVTISSGSNSGIKPRALSDAVDPDKGHGSVTSRPTSLRSQLPARVKFCQWDTIGCINCADTTISSGQASFPSLELGASSSEPSAVASDNTSYLPSTRKLGPLLLDLRRIHFNEAKSDDTEEMNIDAARSLFSTSTICQSRGNPSLGTSVASTCLDFLNVDSWVCSGNETVPPCATGLSTGALCIHSFLQESDGMESKLTPSIEYYNIPRHHRPATAVSWRPNGPPQVAIGYSYASSGTGVTGNSNAILSTTPTAINSANTDRSRRLSNSSVPSTSSHGANPGDREYCCLIWDVEHQSSHQVPQAASSSSAPGTSRPRTQSAPLYKLSHAFGVASLGWILEGGQTLVVGGQQRNLQLYDLRASPAAATSIHVASPTSVFGHTLGVHGIEVDPTRLSVFATYSRTAGEPVKLWDARHMDAPVAEIKIGGSAVTIQSDAAQGRLYRSSSAVAVSSVKWSPLTPGLLSILIGNSLYDYNTLSSRPTNVSATRMRQSVLDFAHYPFVATSFSGSARSQISTEHNAKKNVLAELLPKRIVAIHGDQSVHVVPAHRIAPITVSQRTGQIIHALGRTLFASSLAPGSIEGSERLENEDVSAVMWRRARCLHVAKYSMDASSNIKLLSGEISERASGVSTKAAEEQLRLWKWILRVETLCSENVDDSLGNGHSWSSKSLVDSGVYKLLALDEASPEQKRYSDTLSCATYDSPGRRYVRSGGC
jgi:hypothetical protein